MGHLGGQMDGQISHSLNNVKHIIQTIQYTSTLNLEAALCSSETMVTTYKTTWYHNSKDHNQHLHCCENLKSQIRIGYSNTS
jgi:hypothetical protein